MSTPPIVDRYSHLTYGDTIRELFETRIFAGCDEEDRHELTKQFEAAGLTLERLDQDIATGVANGYSVEQQMQMVAKVLGARSA